MKTIQLTQGYVTQVDDADHEWLMQWKWCASVWRRNGRVTLVNAVRTNGKGRTFLMHREILGLLPGGAHIDHIDCDPLNNQRANLRTCTHAENSRNRKAFCGGTYKGIVRVERRVTKWIAQIGYNGTVNYLGTFNTEVEAAIAYNEAAIKYHGAFARLNVIPQTA